MVPVFFLFSFFFLCIVVDDCVDSQHHRLARNLLRESKQADHDVPFFSFPYHRKLLLYVSISCLICAGLFVFVYGSVARRVWSWRYIIYGSLQFFEALFVDGSLYRLFSFYSLMRLSYAIRYLCI